MISQRRQIESAKNIKMENEIPSRLMHAKFIAFFLSQHCCVYASLERNHNKMLAEREEWEKTATIYD